MKRTIFFVIVMIFTMSSTIVIAADRKSNSVATENKLSELELSRLTNRAEEIRNLDKSDMTVKENLQLKKEAREIDKNVAKSGGTVYIGAAALILIILLIVVLV